MNSSWANIYGFCTAFMLLCWAWNLLLKKKKRVPSNYRHQLREQLCLRHVMDKIASRLLYHSKRRICSLQFTLFCKGGQTGSSWSWKRSALVNRRPTTCNRVLQTSLSDALRTPASCCSHWRGPCLNAALLPPPGSCGTQALPVTFTVILASWDPLFSDHSHH